MAQELMTTNQVLKYLKCTPSYLRYARKHYGFPTIKISHKVLRFDKKQIDQWVNKMDFVKNKKS